MNLSNEQFLTSALLTVFDMGQFSSVESVDNTPLDLQVEKVILTLNAQVSISEAGHQKEL